MGDVVPLRRCRRCNAPADTHREVEFQGAVVFDFWCCAKCWEETTREAAHNRRIFEALLELGVDRRVANDMMIAMFRSQRGEAPE